jgi:2-polyprenyl-3-methyl-5-hydroxy-6-metoxy-1,4-benzoquinol methylase
MQERHINRQKYFEEQTITTSKYVIPFLKPFIADISEISILEIGCGEGGNLKPFLDLGAKCVGIDLSSFQIENAKSFFENDLNKLNISFINEDIYKVQPLEFQFDVIMLRDVIEHIPHQEQFMTFVKRFLKKDGVLFFGFPPWYNPFGGHQQVLKGLASKIPYYHILPKTIYLGILNLFGYKKKEVQELLEIHDTGISIERFERIVKKEKYKILRKTDFLFNPNYEIKFGLKPKRVVAPFNKIPFFRNFYTTAVYYVMNNE